MYAFMDDHLVHILQKEKKIVYINKCSSWENILNKEFNIAFNRKKKETKFNNTNLLV